MANRRNGTKQSFGVEKYAAIAVHVISSQYCSVNNRQNVLFAEFKAVAEKQQTEIRQQGGRNNVWNIFVFNQYGYQRGNAVSQRQPLHYAQYA